MMQESVTIERYYSQWEEENVLLVDVRTASEYRQAHIPGAINLPILDDEERALVGTRYKQMSVPEAKQLGVEFVSKKLPELFAQFQLWNMQYKRIFLYCARGGFRSTILNAFLSSLGIRCYKLEGGYKAYRKHVLAGIPLLVAKKRFVILVGHTGSGKTNILKELDGLGEHILDLEGYANHRGSLLGSVALGEPNGQKMFEGLLFDALRKTGDFLYVEGESRKIGICNIPASLHEAMAKSPLIQVTAPLACRVATIREEYVKDNADEICKSLEPLKRYIKEERITAYQESVRAGKVDEVIADLMRSYYDQRYAKRKTQVLFDIENTNVKQSALEIQNRMRQHGDAAPVEHAAG